MGLFLIINKSFDFQQSELTIVDEVFFEMGFTSPTIVENNAFKFYIYKKLLLQDENLFLEDDLNFVFSVGTMFYEQLSGAYALRMLFSELKTQRSIKDIADKLTGNYCLVVSLDGVIFVLNDRLGLYHTYVNDEFSVISNSFLAVSQFTKKRSINLQAVTEYLLTGVIYGGETYINEVRHLDKNLIYNISENSSISKKSLGNAEYSNERIDFFIERFTSILGRVFTPLKLNFHEDKIHSALTAGYDSRLMLAAMRYIGLKPNLYVYDNGTPDLNISTQIAENLNLSLRQYKYLDYPILEDLDEAVAIIHKSFLMNDGKNDSGVFYQGYDWLMRHDIFKGAHIHMNGFGGELLRNSYGLYETNLSFRDFFKIRYDRMNYERIVKNEKKEFYYSNLQKKFAKEISVTSNILTRIDVQKLLALNHYQYWGGTNQSLKGRFTHSFTPLMDVEFVQESFRIPMKYRNFGALNMKLIVHLDLHLAKQTSNYGYNFYDGPDVKQKTKELLRIHTPLMIRPLLRKYLRKRLPETQPSILRSDIISKMFQNDNFILDEYFHLENLDSLNMLSRFYTVEYYFRRYL